MKRLSKGGAERDVAGRWGRRYYTYLTRAGVTAGIKRAMRRRERREARPDALAAECRTYWCPTGEDYECCGWHGGFDVCCAAPDLHTPITWADHHLLWLRQIGPQAPAVDDAEPKPEAA